MNCPNCGKVELKIGVNRTPVKLYCSECGYTDHS